MAFQTPSDCPLGSNCPLVEDFQKEQDKVISVQTDIALLKRDIAIFDKYFERMDKTVEKIGNAVDEIHRLVIIHEERIEDYKNESHEFKTLLAERKTEIADLKDDITKSIESVKKEVLAEFENFKRISDKRLKNLENWRFFIVGAVVVLGLVITPLVNRIINPSMHIIQPTTITQPITK